MPETAAPKISKWPFYAMDLLLLGVAFLIYWQFPLPMTFSEALLLTGSVALGAWLGVTPHLLEYRAATRLTEAERLNTAVLQMRNIEDISRQISSATANWQAVQDDSAKALQAAREISQEMTTEARAFQEFLQKANETERTHLRLEVDKLRRAEGEWVQVLMRILDHVYALHQAAVRSGHAGLVEQLSGFQRACRDAARRIGLAAYAPKPGEAFDPSLHQPSEDQPTPPAEARVADTLATGYRFQGQLVRKALVVFQGSRQETSDLSISMINQRRGGSQSMVSPLEPPPTASQAPVAASPPSDSQLPTAAEPGPASDVQQEHLDL